VVSQYFWPENFLINDVVKDLQEIGCEITVLTGQPNYPDGNIFRGYSALNAGKAASPGHYDLFRVPVLLRGKGALRRVLNYLSFVMSAASFGVPLLRRRQFDVVFVYAVSPILQALPAMLLARVKRAALVVWVQDLWPDTLESTGYVTDKRVLRWIGRVTCYIYRRCDLILAQSIGFVAKIRELAASPVTVEVHYNPGRHEATLSAADMDVPRLPKGFNIVFAGNLGTAQSLETILSAAELLVNTECQFVIVGSGSRSEWLVDEIERRGLANVHAIGHFPSQVMPGVFKQASALLVTLARAENLALTIPSKIPTYLAAGKPVIACLDGEAAEMIKNSGAGLAVPAEDPTALARAIGHLMDLPESAREEIGRAGLKYFQETFAPGRLAQSLKRHLEQAVCRRNPARTGEYAADGKRK
jgi:glycosyltransferase involved in cell wall biosynthesis